jgi:hypothetical protein
MHGTREALLDLQAAALGLPCWKVYIPAPCPNEVYERNLKVMLDRAAQQGLSHVVFGDLALQDVRRYREAQLAVWCTLLVGAPAAGAPVWRVVGAADGCPATHAIAAALARLLPAGRVTEDPEEAAPILVRVEDHGRSNRG